MVLYIGYNVFSLIVVTPGAYTLILRGITWFVNLVSLTICSV